MTPEQAAALRAPFPPSQIGQLPRGGVMLAYVGHGAVTDRLLTIDPEWSWEPVADNVDGTPLIRVDGTEAHLWIRLTVCGVTRLGVGTAPAKSFELPKQLISDAIRNAAMRFGVALDLWSKQELDAAEPPEPEPARPTSSSGPKRKPPPPPPTEIHAPTVISPTVDEWKQLGDAVKRLDDQGHDLWEVWKSDEANGWTSVRGTTTKPRFELAAAFVATLLAHQPDDEPS